LLTALATLLGVALIVVALRDIFHQLFHPSGTGGLSGRLMKSVWRVFRLFARRYPSLLALAGPSALVATIASWTVLLAVGWALIYWPRLPEAFSFSPTLNPSKQTSFIDALYVSLYTLSTLGYGTISPSPGWLRIVATLEAVIGFALLTASLTWVVSIYPPLTRRRSLAQRIALLGEAESSVGLSITQVETETAERRLDSLTSQLVTVRSDLTQFPVTYYFHSGDERSSLPANMHTLLRIAQEGAEENNPQAIRLGATELRGAIDAFSATVGQGFLGLRSSPTEEVLKAYARDHLRRSFGKRE
jgi:voltage-gated potassium channel Kch